MTPNPCNAVRDGRLCIRPAGHGGTDPYPQHRALDGKTWYYSDGERDVAQQKSIPELLSEIDIEPCRGENGDAWFDVDPWDPSMRLG